MSHSSSFKDLQERYSHYAKLSHEELVEEIGSWWADVFESCKERIKIIVEGREKNE